MRGLQVEGGSFKIIFKLRLGMSQRLGMQTELKAASKINTEIKDVAEKRKRKGLWNIM